jgi:hypothetical protein
MKKKKVLSKYIASAILLVLAILFIAKFGGPSILRLYIETGIGTCHKIPILCMEPQEKINTPLVNKDYILELLTYKFPKMSICLPKGFTVSQERMQKVYYKRKRKGSAAIIYLLYEEPNFFVNLFPQLKKQGIKDDYEFIRRTMSAKLTDIKNITDAFFVIMKSIFTPDVGNQSNLKMAQFTMPGKKGFINYNISKTDNYFDCNVIDDEGDFFKIYIKDKGATLGLDKVLAIISTATRGL